jgi:hypothetical protein
MRHILTLPPDTFGIQFVVPRLRGRVWKIPEPPEGGTTNKQCQDAPALISRDTFVINQVSAHYCAEPVAF